MTGTDHEMMEEAMRLASECQPVKPSIPKVGAILAVGREIIGRGRRGTGNDQDDDHAELTALGNVARRDALAHATLYTTLEPCTPFVRSQGYNCCTEHIKRAEVKKVFIGTLDPNQGVCGKGILELQSAGIEVELFPPELAKRIRLQNEPFIIAQRSLGIRIITPRSGDIIRTFDRDGTFDFEGEFINPPGDDVFVLTNRGGQWSPQPHPIQQTGNKRWAVRVHFGTYGEHSVYVVKADELGSALVRYYRKVCRHNLERKEQLKGNLKTEGEAEARFLRSLRGDYPAIEMARLPKGLELQDWVDIVVETPPLERQ